MKERECRRGNVGEGREGMKERECRREERGNVGEGREGMKERECRRGNVGEGLTIISSNTDIK